MEGPFPKNYRPGDVVVTLRPGEVTRGLDGVKRTATEVGLDPTMKQRWPTGVWVIGLDGQWVRYAWCTAVKDASHTRTIYVLYAKEHDEVRITRE